MSFPRAAIKRFNEPSDTTTPPPGAYDPKFATDVAVIASSAAKGVPVSEKLSRQNGTNVKSRSEDTEPSSHHQNGRISRNPSFTRKSTTMLNAADAGKRGDPVLKKKSSGNSRSRLRPRTSSSSMTKGNNNSMKRTPSTTSPRFGSSSHQNVNPDEQKQKNEEELQNPSKLNQSKSLVELLVNNEGETDETTCPTVIQEIQNMAQSLQVEVCEYKRRLSNEIIRCKELEAKKLELEYTIQSLQRQLKKYDAAKHGWEEADFLHQSKIEELNLKTTELEEQINELHQKLESSKMSEEKLLGKIAALEHENESLENKRNECEMLLKETQEAVLEAEKRRLDVEEKCRELTSQMDCCYHSCESRAADMENMKETFEVKVQELTQQKEDLLKELDSVRRALETQTTLLELSKSEEKGRQDDYIS